MSRQATLSSIALAGSLALLPVHAGQRAFVSSLGNDANLAAGCTLASPCRTFQTAHTAVDAGGEIVALDAAGYAPVSITKSVSIIGNPGFVAGITAPQVGVNIATAGVHVVLRNLNIRGGGAFTGVDISAGSSLAVENCVITNFGTGLFISAAADVRILHTLVRGNGGGAWIMGGASVDIAHSQFLGNGGHGVFIEGNTAAGTIVAVSDSVVSGHGSVGFYSLSYLGPTRLSVIRTTVSNNGDAAFRNESDGAGGAALMTVGSSMVSGNATGFINSVLAGGGTATLESMSNNIVRQNTTASTGVITAVPGL